VYLYSSQGLGLVHTQDVVIAADALADHRWHEKKCFPANWRALTVS